MKQQYQTRYEWLHESYQKWLPVAEIIGVNGNRLCPTEMEQGKHDCAQNIKMRQRVKG